MEFIDFAIRNWVLFALALVIIGALIGTELMHRMGGVKPLDPTQVTQLINHQDALLVDLRSDADYRAGHISNARHIPFGELKQRVKELAKFKTQPVVLYCSTGTQTGSAGKILKKEGFTSLHQLRGGLRAWQNANLPLSKSKKKA